MLCYLYYFWLEVLYVISICHLFESVYLSYWIESVMQSHSSLFFNVHALLIAN